MEIPYLEFFGLQEKPFGITPDPYLYFDSATHRDALDHLGFFASMKEGFALVYGDVGTGKTTVSRVFLNSLDPAGYNTALILNPIMTDEEFLKEVLKEFKLGDEALTKKEMLDTLSRFLISEQQEGRKSILVIDEAQLLSDDMLEFIRILSNLETDKEKILQIVLFGQPEIIEKLRQDRMRYLSQRITVMYMLKPLNLDEVNLYITYRLLKAGSKGNPKFTTAAVRRIYLASKGCPRLINVICDRAILAAYAAAQTTIDENRIEEALKEQNLTLLTEQTTMPEARKRYLQIAVAVLVCLALGTVLGFAVAGRQGRSASIPQEVSKTPAALQVQAAPAPASPAPTVAPPPVSDGLPWPVLYAEQQEHILIADKKSGTVKLYRTGPTTAELLRTVGATAVSGSQGVPSTVQPGIYFLSRFVPGRDLANRSWLGALLWSSTIGSDKSRKGEGRELALYGNVASSKEQQSTRGMTKHAFSIDGEAFKDVLGYARPGAMALVVTEDAVAAGPADQQTASAVTSAIRDWRESWEKLDTERNLSFYSDRFTGPKGLNRSQVAERKKAVNKEKKFVRIQIDGLVLLASPDPGRKGVTARFYQKYYSDNFSDQSMKVLFYQNTDGGWKIVTEETVPL